jgi:hypothetical protein
LRQTNAQAKSHDHIGLNSPDIDKTGAAIRMIEYWANVNTPGGGGLIDFVREYIRYSLGTVVSGESAH